jgi:hypothetical protein
MIFVLRFFRSRWGGFVEVPEGPCQWGVDRTNTMCGVSAENTMCGVERSNTFSQRREPTQS